MNRDVYSELKAAVDSQSKTYDSEAGAYNMKREAVSDAIAIAEE
jgi:hypothetical protein